MRNLHNRFVLCSNGQIYLRLENFFCQVIGHSGAIQKICHSINGLNPLWYLTGLSGIGGRSLTRVGPIADKIERLPDWTEDFKRQLLNIIFIDGGIMWNSTLISKRTKLLPCLEVKQKQKNPELRRFQCVKVSKYLGFS